MHTEKKEFVDSFFLLWGILVHTWYIKTLYSFFLIAACALGMLYAFVHYSWIDFSRLDNYQAGKPSIVLDDQGNEIMRFQFDRRDPIRFDQLPKQLIQAFLAAEDWHFFSHYGISVKGIIRSMLINIYHRRIVQGASTITQQLVKLLFFDTKRTFSRKIKEQVYALFIEYSCTKEQILETYLNHVYFGSGIYGVQAACQRFWGIDVQDISLEQAATLAGIVRSPASYCPLLALNSSQRRRNVVLNSMKVIGFITPEIYQQAREIPLQIVSAHNNSQIHYLKDLVRQWAEEHFGKKILYTGGLIIQTTINMELQKNAQRAFEQQCMLLRKNMKIPLDGGLISLEVKTGAIKALVGGMDFFASQFNRVTQAKRQMGSTFKPLIYATAMQEGRTFADTEIDEPLVLDDGRDGWKPKNYDEKFHGQMTLAYALSHSSNIVAIKVLLKAGIDNVVRLAHRCKLKGPLHPYPSLALGCVDATLLEVAGMFNIFAHQGKYTTPHYIVWVKDQWGTKLYKTTVEEQFVADSYITGQVAKVLELNFERMHTMYGDVPWLKSSAIVKTGTTNDSRTCWFVGSTPALTTAVYIGCDDNRPLGKNVYPLHTAFPIWLVFNRKSEKKIDNFVYDIRLKEQKIHERTGILVNNANEKEHVTILV